MQVSNQDRTKPSTKLRKLLAEPRLIKGVNIYDPLTARIAEDIGFKFIAMGPKTVLLNCSTEGATLVPRSMKPFDRA